MKKYVNNLKTLLFFLLIINIPCIFLITMKCGVKAIEEKEQAIIVIDPGHGGIDGGGMSSTGVYEKDINLQISNYLKIYLENSGYNVILTRYDDYDLASNESKNRKNEDIKKRVEIINEDNVILFISIHCNIFSDSKIRGAQTFYNPQYEESKLLSNDIQTQLNNILKNTTRQSKSINGKYLIDHSKKIGCLVEVGFLSNQQELNLLITPIYQNQVAYCIYIGIIQFLGINNNL